MANESRSYRGWPLWAVFLIFLTLKLAEIGPVAHWSWWWVTAPIWGVFALALLILVGGSLLVGGATILLESLKKTAK